MYRIDREQWFLGMATFVIFTFLSFFIKIIWFETPEEKNAKRDGFIVGEIKYNSIMKEDELINRMTDLTGRRLITFYAKKYRNGGSSEHSKLFTIPVGSISIVNRDSRIINLNSEYSTDQWILNESEFEIVDEALRLKNEMDLNLIYYVQGMERR